MGMNDCPFCSLEKGDKIFGNSFAPTLCWFKTTKLDNGLIEMEFGYGDGDEHLFYMPKFCPECGKENKPDDTV